MSEDEQSFFQRLLNSPEGRSLKVSCGGKGICGGCKIKAENPVPPPTMADRRHLSPGELREGFRLACTLPEHYSGQYSIPKADREIQGVFSRSVDFSGMELPLPMDVLAIDLGTTTIAMTLFSGKDGGPKRSWWALNPQRKWGADVLSRLKAAMENEGEELKSCVRETLLRGIGECLGDEEAQILLAGNTAMIHLLMGYPVESLGRAPFRPWSTASDLLGLEGRNIRILPGFSAFVGGDIFADLYALPEKEESFLLLDLGTNGEMVLGRNGNYVCAASPAGPAFEGAFMAGVYGADLIRVLAELLEEKKMDETGLLREPYFSEGCPVEAGGAGALLTQKGIRELQKAKAAIAAGIELLRKRGGDPERLYLAGGFGFFLRPGDAVRIGLIPEEYSDRCISMGNAVLPGILRYAAGKGKGEQQLLKRTQALNLAELEGFEESYIRNMNFPRG